MGWIESHTVLKRHRKTRELALELRLRRSYIMGHLHSLWHDALEQQEDGDLSSWTDSMIAESSDYPGDAPQWVRLLQKVGFLDGKVLHDWLEYAGRYLEAKYRTSKPEKLVEIWAKHGKKYGQSVFSRTKASPPNQPNQPNQQTAFALFWAAYPKKVGKDKALDAWIKKRPDLELCLNTLKWQRRQDQWTAEGGKFVPHPTTWLNQGRWADEPIANAPQAQKRTVTDPSNAFDAEKEKAATLAFERSEAWHAEFYKSGACPACGYKIKNDLDICDCETYRAELKQALESFKSKN